MDIDFIQGPTSFIQKVFVSYALFQHLHDYWISRQLFCISKKARQQSATDNYGINTHKAQVYIEAALIERYMGKDL